MPMALDFLKMKNTVLFDGAMGTMLQRAGLAGGVLPETYNFTHPDLVADIHRQYLEAGSDIISTNTFSSSRLKLAPLGLTPMQVMRQAAALARKAGAGIVAADIGPSGLLMAPMGSLTFEDAYQLFAEQAQAAQEAGADLVLLETFSDVYEAKAALLAVKENTDLPAAVTLTFQQNGRTVMGTSPAEAVSVLEGLGADILGVNCSLGPEELLPIVLEFLRSARVPVLVQPNAGLPRMESGQVVYPADPGAFAQALVPMIQAGAALAGGCCGTSPAFIHALRAAFQRITPVRPANPQRPSAASARRTVYLDQGVAVIGDRIHPAGKGTLTEALQKRDYNPLLAEAMDQMAAGAHILDVHVAVPGIPEAVLLPEATAFLQSLISMPLCLDSRDPQALAAAVRMVNGKPLLNAVVCTEASMEALFPLAKTYGACLIGLTLDEHGIPGSVEERVAIARRLSEAAAAQGIPREHLILDCLAVQAGGAANPMAALEAMRRVKTELGLSTILGIRNVSHGHTNRVGMNSAYLAMALACGLDTVLMDPTQEAVMETLHIVQMITGK